MARNPVQFQKGISLNEFLSLYGTEDQCFDALFQWRWPNGFLCPHCGHDRCCLELPHFSGRFMAWVSCSFLIGLFEVHR